MPKSNLKTQAKRKRELAKLDKRKSPRIAKPKVRGQ